MTDRRRTCNVRFIEESFPVKEVSAVSAKETSIRHGHISTLHIWWARRTRRPPAPRGHHALQSGHRVGPGEGPQ